ncbi:MAG: response regulator [Thioalkalispiraceae bacterium]|jgi:two-component system chemotaxis response regulator CheY
MDKITLDQLSALLVEPSSMQRRVITNHLNGFGVMQIESASNGTDALNLMNAKQHDVVISAMHLEDMTGTELVQNMRMDNEKSDIPFMLISSETDFRYLEPIRQAGVIAILPKPYEIDQLKRALFSTVHYLQPGSLDSDELKPETLEVLVVDDSFTARKHIKRVLSNMGIVNLMEAENGLEAVEIIKNRTFDLIVTDYNMPEMDGKQLVEHIRKQSNQKTIPVLMVSSESDDNRLAAVQQAGVSAICDKPFEPGTVKDLLVQMLA